VQGTDKIQSTDLATNLIVTVGSAAASSLVGKTTQPMLLTMLTSNLYQEILTRRPIPSQLSALYVDQPWSRHVELLFAALPQTHRIGLLYSSEFSKNLAELHKLALRHDAKLVPQQISSSAQLFDALEMTLEHSDVVLAVPDSEIYTSNNIRNILMTSYRHNIPLIGISKGYVNAGALCAVFTSPEDLALQAAKISQSFVLNKRLPAAQFPSEYEVATNPEVARTLGIKLKSAEQLHKLLQRAEGGNDAE
jgi:ABC-type uncharacterized transport system substrate-binding protein